MKRSLLTVILFYAGVALLPAQELPDICHAFLPKVILESNVLKESDANKLLADPYLGQKEESTKRYWVAYSDRDNNTTYKNPNLKGEVHSNLQMNELVRIAEIKGRAALVYKEENKSVSYPRISSSAKCLGWVDISNLLLWDTALADEKGIYYKALVCRNLDEKNSTSKSGEIRYMHPTDTSYHSNMDGAMRFYFVMKRHPNGKVLLAMQHNLTGDSHMVLYGWLPEASYIPWNQRTCIEPTWDEEHVEYFASRNVKAIVYDPKLGIEASSWKYSVNDKSDDPYRYRWNKDMLRFPILDGTSDERYECSSFISQDFVNIDAKRREQLEKLKKINLAIVIDGTRSMDPYFPAVYKAIQEGCQFFDTKKYKIKVGVVIYRDYGDGKEGLYEVFPYSKPNDPALMQFLSTGGSYGIKSSAKDKTHAEALFYGMDMALSKLKADPHESSLMLVIGDCGNDINDKVGPAQSELEKKIVRQNVNVVSYQVRNLDSEAWNTFNRQMLQIIKNTLQSKYDNLSKGAVRVKGKISPDGQDFYADVMMDDELYIGSHKYATSGSVIAPDVLVDLMKNSLMRYSNLVQHHLDLVVNPNLRPRSEAVKNATAMDINTAWLKAREVEAGGEMMGFKGWTLKYHSSKIAYYKPVLFLSSEEFTELLSRLEPVYGVACKSRSNDRQPYVQAMKGLLKSFAPGLTDEQMDKMGINNVLAMIQGLNEASASMTSKTTLLDISDPNVVSHSEYRKIVNQFKEKYEVLRRMKDSNYEFVKVFNNAKYYWIPIENLP